jgi:hypothetical protein
MSKVCLLDLASSVLFWLVACIQVFSELRGVGLVLLAAGLAELWSVRSTRQNG